MTTLDLNPIAVTAVTTDPDVSQLTTGSIDGTGVFDELMKTVKAHLLEEFNADRISGAEYTTVYLGALSAVLQQSVAFILNHRQAEEITARVGLIRQQTVTELSQTDDSIPLGLGFNGDTTIEGMVKSKLDLDVKQSLLADAQIAKSTKEGVLTGQQIITELAKTDDSISTAAAEYGLNGSTVIEGLTKSQLDMNQIQIDLTEQKLVTELSQTSDTKPIDLGQTSSTLITGIAQSQKDKTLAEKVLLSQKAITELAQTSDTVVIDTDALNTSTAVTGTVAKQKGLFTAQTDGFARDAEQKLCKMLIDSWSVRATVGEASGNETNHLSDVDVGAVVTKAKTGIGA